VPVLGKYELIVKLNPASEIDPPWMNCKVKVDGIIVLAVKVCCVPIRSVVGVLPMAATAAAKLA
jgi:hypothetical protein